MTVLDPVEFIIDTAILIVILFINYVKRTNASLKRKILIGIAAIIFVIVIFYLLAWEAVISFSPYDNQVGITFVGNYTRLAYTVTAVAQSQTYIPILQNFQLGPAYVLSGYTNLGDWYQIGVGYDWSGTKNFKIIYEAFSSNGLPIYYAKAINFSRSINDNDTILLQMYFQQGNVMMSATDLNNGATGNVMYPAFNSIQFVGGPYKNLTSNGTLTNHGEFTGLMTESYTFLPSSYMNTTKYQAYNSSYDIKSALAFIHEYGCKGFSADCQANESGISVIFSHTKEYQNKNGSIYGICYHGIAEYTNYTTLVIGGKCPFTST